MEEKKNITRVTIFGTEYPIKGDADPTYVREVAQYVDRKMREVTESAPLRSSTKVAILAALNITDELFRERTDRERLWGEISHRIERINDGLNQGLGGESPD